MHAVARSGLLLVAHGSRDPQAAPVAFDVAAAVDGALPDVTARAAFLELARPDPPTALAELTAAGVTTVVIQPFLLGNAYHSKVDLPAARQAADRLGLTARLGPVLAPSRSLAGALLDRLAEVPPLSAGGYDALVVAAAGSSDPEGNAHVAELAEVLSVRCAVPVTVGYASAASPTVETAVLRAREAGAGRVAVATYLLAPGFFATTIRETATRAGAVAVSPPLGACRPVVDLVLTRSGLRSVR